MNSLIEPNEKGFGVSRMLYGLECLAFESGLSRQHENYPDQTLPYLVHLLSLIIHPSCMV